MMTFKKHIKKYNISKDNKIVYQIHNGIYKKKSDDLYSYNCECSQCKEFSIFKTYQLLNLHIPKMFKAFLNFRKACTFEELEEYKKIPQNHNLIYTKILKVIFHLLLNLQSQHLKLHLDSVIFHIIKKLAYITNFIFINRNWQNNEFDIQFYMNIIK